MWSRTTGEQAASVSTPCLHNIAGKYVGKDDPVMLVRAQMNLPATGEIIAPFAIRHFVAGWMRGSHNMPLMPVKLDSTVRYFDGPPVETCAAFCMRGGKLTGPPMDAFLCAAMLPWTELEYTGVTQMLEGLEKRFRTRPAGE